MTNRRWGGGGGGGHLDGATCILAETLHIEYVLVSQGTTWSSSICILGRCRHVRIWTSNEP